MPPGKERQDLDTLHMALIGYELEKQKIDEKISALKKMLKGLKSGAQSAGSGSRRSSGAKREMSAAGRRRIAEAQRKRWAEHRRRKARTAR